MINKVKPNVFPAPSKRQKSNLVMLSNKQKCDIRDVSQHLVAKEDLFYVAKAFRQLG